MALNNKQSHTGSSRPKPLTPISPTPAIASSSHSGESQQFGPSSKCENPSIQFQTAENSDRSIAELVSFGTAAPAHFGTNSRRLLRSASAPTLLSSSGCLPAPLQHFPASKEPSRSLPVHRPRPGRAPIKRIQNPEGLPQLQQSDLARINSRTWYSGASSQAEVGNQSRKRSSQRRNPGIRRKKAVFDLGKSASAVAKARPRSPIFDLTFPTEQELLIAVEHSRPPPPVPPRSAYRPNPYPLITLETPFSPLVRKGAVSYRKSRPLITSSFRDGEQKIASAPERIRQSSTPSSYTKLSRTSESTWSFCKEEFSSSPLATQVTSAGRSQDLDQPRAGASFASGEAVTRTSSGTTIIKDPGSVQEQDLSGTGSWALQSSAIIRSCLVEPLGPSVGSPTADSEHETSSPRAVSKLAFGRRKAESPSGSDRPASGPSTNTPAATHPNLTGFKFSFVTVKSSPEQTSGGEDIVEPALAPVRSVKAGQAPRGVSSAIAQACRRFEPESQSRRSKGTGVQPVATADKDVPKVELPSFPRLCLGATGTHHEESTLSEIARGKRPETRKPSWVPKQPSKDMDALHPESAMVMTEHRREAIRMAKSQEAAVVERCKRSGIAAPGYTFDELIGKGSFGRVYKGRQASSKKVVAIKVIDVDDADFRAFGDHKDEQIKDFNKEIRILRQAQESGAPNLNQMIEALPVHSQLWLVCEYCPGGSVKTLMRATNDKLAERYITVVARELSKALKGLHDAGIMHRDVKAANVLIHEEGSLQLCDFGVATVLDKKTEKRRTFIGTLHWMPPELWDKDPEYSDEVDVWAFGCTLYECAVGKPPNADVREPQQLRSRMRRLNQSVELPENGNYSSGLRSLVSYALTPDAATRPSFSDVLAHEYLANTEETHPTTILSELVKVYYSWLYGGGQRASLFMPGGAVAGDTPGSLTSSDEDWNFSATDSFEHRMSTVLNIPDFSDLSDMQNLGGNSTPKAAKLAARGELSAEEKANFEERVRRGADLSNIFDRDKPDYEYVTKTDFIPVERRRVSDLPLRAMSEERPYSIANQVIDLGDFDSSNYASVTQAKDEKIKLADAATIKANRGNSKLYLDLPASEMLTAKPSISTSEGLTAVNDSSRPATQDFSFPPKEWHKRDQAAEKDGIAGPSRSRNPAKHKTMEWSFASAMSEAQNEDATPSFTSEEAETQSKPKKHDTMQWSFQSAMAEASGTFSIVDQPRQQQQQQQQQQQEQQQQLQRTSRRAPPPLIRSITEPVGTDQSLPRSSISHSESDSTSINDEADPFALDDADNEYPSLAASAAIQQALDERGISSFYGRARGEGLLLRRMPEGEGGRVEDEEDEDEEDEEVEAAAAAATTTVTMPEIHGVDARAMDGEAPPSALESELDRLLAEFRGVLGGAEAAMAVVERRGRERERERGRERKGEGESDWEDDEEEGGVLEEE